MHNHKMCLSLRFFPSNSPHRSVFQLVPYITVADFVQPLEYFALLDVYESVEINLFTSNELVTLYCHHWHYPWRVRTFDLSFYSTLHHFVKSVTYWHKKRKSSCVTMYTQQLTHNFAALLSRLRQLGLVPYETWFFSRDA